MRSPCAETSMDRKDRSCSKGVTEASLEIEVITPLAASQGAKTFIAPSEEIASTMGAAREAADGVDMVPK